MRLFALRRERKGPFLTGPDGLPIYFDNKTDARRAR